MHALNLVYIWSFRNAAADKAGQHIVYKGDSRYMTSPLEYLASALNEGELGKRYHLKGVIYDDDEESIIDCEKVREYGFRAQEGKRWFYPPETKVAGRRLNDMMYSIPSSYRRLPQQSPERIQGKRTFESNLQDKLFELEADVVVLDGLLVILDDLVKPGSPFHRKIVNIHPGITNSDSPYMRRGAYATLDALYGARGQQIVNWDTMESRAIPVVPKTGASFHYVDNGIDSGEVIHDVLNTDIDPGDTILELRWNNFNNSLFPALYQGLMRIADVKQAA